MPRYSPPVSPLILAADHATVLAIQSLSDYQPSNPDYSTAQLLQLQSALVQADQATKTAEYALDEARRVRSEISHSYHNAVIGARVQVIGQFGPDATAVALVGLTRRSERKRPTRREPTE